MVAVNNTAEIGSLKTSLGFSDLLEGLAELNKNSFTHGRVYYSKRTQIKISNSQRFMRQDPGEARCGASSVLSQWSCTNSIHFSQS